MRTGMPYLYSLAQRFGYADNYRAITHPSEPNYLAIVGGSTFGDTADHNPAVQVAGASVFGQARALGRTGRVYAESMISNCQQGNGGLYAARHNPWASFTQERALCQTADVPLGTITAGALHRDVVAGTLPNIGLVIPNLCHDAHDCAVAAADAWLRVWLPAVLAGPDFASGRLAVVITADEDDRRSGNQVLTVVAHRSLDGRHRVVTAPLTHYSLTRYLDTVIGAPPLRAASGATDLRRLFALPS